MNILHHKSWHVRNKDNIIKVRKDEAKHADEEKEKQKRVSIAESEARLDVLRARSSASTSKQVKYEQFEQQGNVNLFAQEEQGKYNEDKNKDAEKEKRAETEKFEKKIGLLKYLVDDELDLKVQPWYKTLKERHTSSDGKRSDDKEIDLKRKMSLDPYTGIKAINEERRKRKKSEREDVKAVAPTKRRDASCPTQASKSKTIEQMRAERLKREGEERVKATRLISNNGKVDSKAEVAKVEVDDRKRKFNNQFNPEFSKY